MTPDSARIRRDLGIPQICVLQIFTEDLGMKCLAAKFIPWLLLQEQTFCVEVTHDWLDTANSDPYFLKKIMTGDKSRVYSYGSAKAQSSQCGTKLCIRQSQTPCVYTTAAATPSTRAEVPAAYSFRGTFTTVSYTHLDVYKRQGYYIGRIYSLKYCSH